MSVAPLSILLAVFLYGLVHSMLASLWMKSLARRTFGEWTDRVYRLAYNIFALLSFLPVLALLALIPDRELYTIPFPWVLITLAIQGLAVLMLLAGIMQTGVWTFLGLRQLYDKDKNGQADLVVSGLYRWIRHPLYTAGLVFIWFVPRMTYNLLALNVGLTIYLIVGAVFEERKLLREYGVDYARYRERTSMLVPGLKRAPAAKPEPRNL